MKVYLKILFVLIVLGAAFWLVFSKYGLFRSDKRFAYQTPSKITKVEIRSDSITTILERGDNEWIVNGEHKANQEVVDNFKLVILKMQVEYPLPKIYAAQLTDTLIMKKGMQIKLYHGESVKRNYYIYSADSIGCIGLINGKQQAYSLYMPGYTVSLCDYISADPSFWLNNIVFSYFPSQIQSVQVENMVEPAQSFKIEQTDRNQYRLKDTYNLLEVSNPDTMAIRRYLTYFHSVNFDSYPNMTDTEKQEILLSDYAYMLTVKTDKGEYSYKIIYIPINDEYDAYGNPLDYDRQRFYLGINNGQDIAIASWLEFDILLKNLSDFVNK